MFEIGVAYRGSDSRLWLAVGETSLASFADGVRVTRAVRERDAYEAARGVSVEGLCRRWGVAVEVIDAALAGEFLPSATGRNATRRHRGKRTPGEPLSRKGTVAEVEAWREIRMHRIQHAR